MIEVRYSGGSYPVHFCEVGQLLDDLPAEAFVITDSNVAGLLSAPCPTFAIAPGEASKSFDTYRQCITWLAGSRASRKATVVALGGGVVGDLAGFVAATYMRGVRLLQIPTTLLSQVDSSVGGKVGIDLPEGKNLVGAFQAPTEVRVASSVLRHLPPRQFTNGMAEVLKYGFIMDRPLLDRLSADALTVESPSLPEVIHRCIELKAQVVEADEFETTGFRAILNFGHTVGHAIEKVLGYEDLLHGEAISIGMAVEARLGERLGLAHPGLQEAVESTLRAYDLPTRHLSLRRAEELVAAMRSDKKATGGKLAFSLLSELGRCKLITGVEEAEILATLEEF